MPTFAEIEPLSLSDRVINALKDAFFAGELITRSLRESGSISAKVGMLNPQNAWCSFIYHRSTNECSQPHAPSHLAAGLCKLLPSRPYGDRSTIKRS
jgi:hypothetical protein